MNINKINYTNSNTKYLPTIILLCIGYFIDFYDLTIFSASYSNVIKDLFNLHNTQEIQLLYLKITNFYTIGIIFGSLLFGVLGDRIGRTNAIRYSILLYSFSIIASAFTHNIWLFIFLRFLSGAGLASEFANSSVLLMELLPVKLASRSISILYFCGVLGGLTAIVMASISWKILFLSGGIAGLILYISRKKLIESDLFLELEAKDNTGNLFQLVSTIPNIIKLLKLSIIILPFYFLISIMFIYPSFMNLNTSLGESIRTLLIGFFIGNLISSLGSSYILTKFKNYKVYLSISTLSFCILLSIFKLIDQNMFFIYSIGLGLLGGGHPAVWMQLVTKHYGTNQRSTAANALYALGRGSGIGFNLLLSVWIVNPQFFNYYSLITVITITIIVFTALKNTGSYYNKSVNYIERYS